MRPVVRATSSLGRRTGRQSGRLHGAKLAARAAPSGETIAASSGIGRHSSRVGPSPPVLPPPLGHGLVARLFSTRVAHCPVSLLAYFPLTREASVAQIPVGLSLVAIVYPLLLFGPNKNNETPSLLLQPTCATFPSPLLSPFPFLATVSR